MVLKKRWLCKFYFILQWEPLTRPFSPTNPAFDKENNRQFLHKASIPAATRNRLRPQHHQRGCDLLLHKCLKFLQTQIRTAISLSSYSSEPGDGCLMPSSFRLIETKCQEAQGSLSHIRPQAKRLQHWPKQGTSALLEPNESLSTRSATRVHWLFNFLEWLTFCFHNNIVCQNCWQKGNTTKTRVNWSNSEFLNQVEEEESHQEVADLVFKVTNRF